MGDSAEIVRVEFSPAVISCDFDEMGRRLDEMLEPYEGMTPETAAGMDEKAAKACRAELNRMSRELNDARKAVKKDYEAPLREFEAHVKELDARIRRYADILGDALMARDAAERARKRAAIEERYVEFAGALAQALPFDRVLDPKWLNRSTSFKKAVDDMEDRVASIAADYESLKSQAGSLAFFAEDEAVFLRTLSLREALEHDAKRREETERIEAMKAEVESIAAKQPDPEPEVDMDEVHEEYVYEPDLGDAPYAPPCEDGPELDWVIEARMTQGQADMLVSWLKSMGIHGTIGVRKDGE